CHALTTVSRYHHGSFAKSIGHVGIWKFLECKHILVRTRD
ncbi:14912_t:CDS:1, partial [Funneliformis caledonium]